MSLTGGFTVIEDEGSRSQLKHSIIPCKGTTYVVVEARSERRCQSSLPGSSGCRESNRRRPAGWELAAVAAVGLGQGSRRRSAGWEVAGRQPAPHPREGDGSSVRRDGGEVV